MTTFHDGGPLQSARRLAGQIRDCAGQIEHRRTVPPDLAAKIRQSGLFHLMTPRSLGGLEAEPSTIVEVIEELSRADASTGWTAMIGQGAGFLAWLDPQVAAELTEAYPRPVVVGSMAPSGRARPLGGQPGALSVTGRWPYASGCGLADLIFVACPVGGERPAGGGAPASKVRFVLLTPAQVQIADTWQVVGLRGTGSHDIEVSDAQVPMQWTFDPFRPARAPGPLYRLPYMTYLMTAMAGFPLGVARRIVDEYFAVAKAQRTVAWTRLAGTPLAQADLAHCEAAVRAARAAVFESLAAVWAQALAGVPSPRSRAVFTGAVQHAMRTALEVADAALRACGTSQLYTHAPLQRYFRDVQAAAQHIAFGLDAQRRVGAALLDLDVPLALL